MSVVSTWMLMLAFAASIALVASEHIEHEKRHRQ